MKIKLLSIAAALTLAVTTGASAADRNLKVQTSSNASHFSLIYLNENWSPRLEEMTGGALSIELMPLEAVVPRRETPDAISMGILDGDLTVSNYFSGKGLPARREPHHHPRARRRGPGGGGGGRRAGGHRERGRRHRRQ